jgi:hypothetical protein
MNEAAYTLTLHSPQLNRFDRKELDSSFGQQNGNFSRKGAFDPMRSSRFGDTNWGPNWLLLKL